MRFTRRPSAWSMLFLRHSRQDWSRSWVIEDVCPHGNGLALRSVEEGRKKRLCLLSEAELDPVYQVFVYDRDRKLLEFFDQKGIRPGTRLKVRSRNYDGTLSLAV